MSNLDVHLQNKGFIKLPTGSFFNYVEKDWLAKFIPYMVYKKSYEVDMLIVDLKYINEFNNIYDEYTSYKLIELNKELEKRHISKERVFDNSG